ncbi:MAG: FixH family protein [Myxococcota bacterium]
MSPGSRYILLVLGLLGFSVATCIALFAFATRDPSFAVEKNYYQKAVDFDRLRAEEEASDRLGWVVEVEPIKVAKEGEVTLVLKDATGHLLAGAHGTVEAFANARAAQHQTGALEELGPGKYRVKMVIGRAGSWELRLRLERGPDVFTDVKRVFVEGLGDVGVGAPS